MRLCKLLFYVRLVFFNLKHFVLFQKDDEAGIKNIIKKICEFEDEFQTTISDYYAENEASFKKVRR